MAQKLKLKLNSKESKSSVKDYKNYSLLKNLARNVLFKKRFLARLNHNPKSFILKSGAALKPVQIDDSLLIERLKKILYYMRCQL